MTKIHRWLNEYVWFATIHYLDGTTVSFPIKNNSKRFETKTGFMNATLFTLKDAHYVAFGQGGFGIKNILLARRDIRYCMRTRTYEVRS